MAAKRSRETAFEILPHFAKNVLAKRVRTYGHYAQCIGLTPSKDGLKVGHAMHVIGAACVFRCVPIAPLHYVKGADGEWRKVFKSDPLEARDVLPHYDALLTSARAYEYNEQDFQNISESIDAMVNTGSIKDYDLSPHHLWHWAIVNKPEGYKETYFERALSRYKIFIESERRKRQEKEP